LYYKENDTIYKNNLKRLDIEPKNYYYRHKDHVAYVVRHLLVDLIEIMLKIGILMTVMLQINKRSGGAEMLQQ
jgi:hypothetical protein